MFYSSGSRCITMFYMCFMMFNYVLWCLASRATIGDCALPIATGIGDNSAEISDNLAEIGDDAAGIVDIAANVIPSQTPSWMETGVTLFLEDKFQMGSWGVLEECGAVTAAIGAFGCICDMLDKVKVGGAAENWKWSVMNDARCSWSPGYAPVSSLQGEVGASGEVT